MKQELTSKFETLDAATVEQFQQDGAVVLRGVFAGWVERLRDGIESLISNPSPLERTYNPEDGSARFFQDLCNWQRIPQFEQFIRQSGAAQIAACLMGSKTARFFHDHVLVKEPGSSIRTPWHQDQPYYCVDGAMSVSFWIPLDNVPIESSLECVAGSHRWGKDHRPKRFDGSNLYAEDNYEELPDIDAQREQFDIRSWALEPGDAIAFHFRTIHAAAANVGRASRRRAFSARWVGDDAVFRDRAGKGSPPFSHLRLVDGEPLDGDDFPVFPLASM